MYEGVELLAVMCKLKLLALPAQGMEDGKGDVRQEEKENLEITD